MPRPSRVRDAIRHLVTTSDRHDWSAEDVQDALTHRSVSADFSSVCRGLARLEGEGIVRRVNLGDGRIRYEARRGHHDHVLCERCGAVAEVPDCIVEAAQGPVEVATGFRITGHSLLFSGICSDCAERGPAL